MISEESLGEAWDDVLNQTRGLLFPDAWNLAAEILHDRFNGHFNQVRVDCGYTENPPAMTARGKFRARVWTEDAGEVRYFLFGDWSDQR
jgi:hypothetical protein